jgi:hypothetical protein
MDGRLWPFGVSANLLSVGSVPPKLGHYPQMRVGIVDDIMAESFAVRQLKTYAFIFRFFASRCTECPACVRDPREREYHPVGAYRRFRRIAGTYRSAVSPIRLTC